MKLALFASSGAWLTSRFHQLSLGKSGSGCGMVPDSATPWARTGGADTAIADIRPTKIVRARVRNARGIMGFRVASARIGPEKHGCASPVPEAMMQTP